MTKESKSAAKPRLRWYQYSLASLFVLMTVAALGCAWFRCKMAEADRRKEVVKAIEEMGGEVLYDYQVDAKGNPIPDAEPPGPAWFRDFVGLDFMADVVVCSITLDRLDTDVTCPQVTDEWIKQHIVPLTHLNRLTLSSSRVTDAGLEHLKGLTSLKELDLSHTQVNGAGLEHLKGMTELEVLWLGETHVSDAGLEYLGGLTNLELLDLGNTKVSDAGLEHLKGLTKLEILSLFGARVSDAGLEHLKGLTKLKNLSVFHTQVSDNGAKKLQQALPNCNIMW